MARNLRLGKAAGELNVSMGSLVDFLRANNIYVVSSPNTKLTLEQRYILYSEFDKQRCWDSSPKINEIYQPITKIHEDFKPYLNEMFEKNLQTAIFSIESFLKFKDKKEVFREKTFSKGINDINHVLNYQIIEGKEALHLYDQISVDLMIVIKNEDLFKSNLLTGNTLTFRNSISEQEQNVIDVQDEEAQKDKAAFSGFSNSLDYRREWEQDMMGSLGYIPEDGPSVDPDDIY